LSRYFAALAIFTVFAFFSIVAIFPLAKFHEIAYEAEKYYKLGFASFLLGFAILGFAFFASSLVSERGKSSFIVGGTLILMYVMNILAGLKDSLKNLQYLSFFHYYNGTTLLVKNEYVQYSVPVLLGVGIVFLILGLLSFNKRDIAV
jgi:ABC-type transport system involved in multi-copper enzyme maturation permease subunit